MVSGLSLASAVLGLIVLLCTLFPDQVNPASPASPTRQKHIHASQRVHLEVWLSVVLEDLLWLPMISASVPESVWGAGYVTKAVCENPIRVGGEDRVIHQCL